MCFALTLNRTSPIALVPIPACRTGNLPPAVRVRQFAFTFVYEKHRSRRFAATKSLLPNATKHTRQTCIATRTAASQAHRLSTCLGPASTSNRTYVVIRSRAGLYPRMLTPSARGLGSCSVQPLNLARTIMQCAVLRVAGIPTVTDTLADSRCVARPSLPCTMCKARRTSPCRAQASPGRP